MPESQPAPIAPPELPYGTLNKRSLKYDAALIEELDDLYVGGYQIQRNAEKYLPRAVGEHVSRHEERVQQTAYIPYLGHVVDHFASAVFSQPLHVRPSTDDPSTADEEFYETFANDADLTSASFHEVCKTVLTKALLHKRALLAVDFPPRDESVATRLDEERSGVDRAFVDEICVDEMIDWDVERVVRKRVAVKDGSVEFDVGWFKWCVLYSARIERPSPFVAQLTHIESWKIWRGDPETGEVTWARYELRRPLKQDGSLDRVDPKTPVPLVAGGPTSFSRVPIVELTLPDGLWVGNKVGPLNKEHYQRRSLINGSENRSLGAVPFAKLGPEVPALHDQIPALVQQDPNRGETLQKQMAERGYVVIGSDDDLGYLEPEGSYADLAEKRLALLVDDIYRVSHLMAASVSSTSSSVGRSGASKAEDRYATTIVLCALGAIVREFARRVYEVISESRGETVTWVATGLDHYDLYDRAELIDEAVAVDTIGIKSKTFIVAYKTELATRLMPNLSPEEKADIQKEIEAAHDEAEEQAKQMQEQALAAGVAGAAPAPPGKPGAPPGKPVPGKPATAPPKPAAKPPAPKPQPPKAK